MALAERIDVIPDPMRKKPLVSGKVKVRSYAGESTHKPNRVQLGEKDRQEALTKLRKTAARVCQFQNAKEAELSQVTYKTEGMADRIHETEEFIHYIRAEGKVSCFDKDGNQLPVPGGLMFIAEDARKAIFAPPIDKNTPSAIGSKSSNESPVQPAK